MNSPHDRADRDDVSPFPPPLQSWPRVYAAVLINLAVWIGFFAWLTEIF